jgi:hypothetical protein
MSDPAKSPSMVVTYSKTADAKRKMSRIVGPVR